MILNRGQKISAIHPIRVIRVPAFGRAVNQGVVVFEGEFIFNRLSYRNSGLKKMNKSLRYK